MRGGLVFLKILFIFLKFHLQKLGVFKKIRGVQKRKLAFCNLQWNLFQKNLKTFCDSIALDSISLNNTMLSYFILVTKMPLCFSAPPLKGTVSPQYYATLFHPSSVCAILLRINAVGSSTCVNMRVKFYCSRMHLGFFLVSFERLASRPPRTEMGSFRSHFVWYHRLCLCLFLCVACNS